MSNRSFAPWLVLLLGVPIIWVGWLGQIPQEGNHRIDPATVRAAARVAGLESLQKVPVPKPRNLHEFVRDTPLARVAVRQLGKALFWDMQVGSDGQACASCHFHAGADNRRKNQLNPGPGDQTFGNIGAGLSARAGHPSFGPNYELTPADFPFHGLDPCGATDFSRRIVLQDTNDIASSQGTVNATLTAVVPGQSLDSGVLATDPVFNVTGINLRRTTPRHTPSVINAVFNIDNFWDGRAKSDFNGSSPFGPLMRMPAFLKKTAPGRDSLNAR
jgi:hypothetical protein